REGRALFFDASKSRDNNTSCATCHVEGESDFLVWNLSAGPSDDKGPMMTQTLAGIERMAPFHWRGERAELSDFNPAFVELLGGEELDETPGGEFEAFEAFVFSIQNRPNPDQSPYRILDADLPAPTVSGNGDAVRGQTAFFTEATFGVFTCNDCHQMPLGTNNDDFQDLALENRPKRSRFNVAPFHGMEERADMPRDEVILWNDPEDPLQGTTTNLHAALGAGTSHAGLTADLQTFVDAVGNLGNSDPEMSEDITAFVAQFDTGIAGSAVQARYLDASSSLAERREVANLLLGQANARNCSLAVLGETVTAAPGRVLVTRRWSYDPFANGGEGLFSCEDPAEGTRSYADFLLGLSAGERLIFIGLPVGS
ncbi:MAG: cytochrome c peroxidase, partial [Planctomycetota bacterium]